MTSGKTLSLTQIMNIKDQYFDALMKEEHIKQDLQRDIDDIAKMKGDLIAEILKQYGMTAKDEQDFYHDKLGIQFDHQLWNIRLLISKNRWRELTVQR